MRVDRLIKPPKGYPFTRFCWGMNIIIFFLAVLVLQSSIPFLTKTSLAQAADQAVPTQTIQLESSEYQQLFHELISKHGFSQQQLSQLFAGVTIKQTVLELMDRQGEARPYYQYWPLFITPSIIAAGKAKLEEHKELLDRIEGELGVDREFIVAIWAIESRFGQNTGQFNVFQTLNTLFAAYPRRSAFFRQELLEFLILCRENDFDPLTIKGSYAGAFGQSQFIPSSFRKYAVSFDSDDRPDVFNSTADVLASIANYLKHFHWQLNAPVYADIGSDLHAADLVNAQQKGREGRVGWRDVARIQATDIPRPPGDSDLSIIGLEVDPLLGGGFRYIAGYPNFQAITAWNHSNRYAMAVSQLAEAFMQ